MEKYRVEGFQEIIHVWKLLWKKKTKEFYELKLGQIAMEELINNPLELLWYVSYIQDDKVKIQSFLSCLPLPYKDIIEVDIPKTLEETL